ncbi:MAG: toxin HipA [Elusimicrobia bacterium CG1_02_63_36]|nr:MAG: toxin HipA [Elusimicrobia bacterium CG1_02_63_36]PIP82533.1 MAG: toxin HipA [Elusimicrobia bacterium CG22_combo_CG10-13_8_21_14_all_63_91]PJA14499.1 MAG: toxin HipA [Elusimicrobia bacterium CG_4_10_14_0_2_um_filter_63_34]PJB26356.1 MAG: toxin HipA [Elusimicrobia bacterium CG_4_9_14_3_um_filter_62_55]
MPTKPARRSLFVFADWEGQDLRPMGELTATPSRAAEVFSFSYDDAWLKSPGARLLDPDLGLYPGPQYLGAAHKSNFGLFLDSAPDRWGRLLLRRREAAQARAEGRAERSLRESDYLLGVHDAQRLGGLRFKDRPDGPFLGEGGGAPVPPWASLRELEHASLSLERDDAADDPAYEDWLALLLAPGTSLGGARPKAGVADPEGRLWIAKFPRRRDERDHAAWELVAHDLARAAGIRVADAAVKRLSSGGRTFLTRRFDRTASGARVHFASAMTMLGRVDGESASYLDLVEIIAKHGARPDEDCAELWRRVVFSIAVANTDDHLRNHGFLLRPDGWRLSPAYDLNPEPHGRGLSLSISENDNALDFDLAWSVRGYFRLSDARAAEIMSRVKETVSGWEHAARRLDIPSSELASMRGAFVR